MPKRVSSSLSHSRVWMLKSIVREAFVTSVTCTSPRVSIQMSQVSTVPNLSFPSSALFRAPGTFSSIQRIFVALKYASMIRPVLLLIRSVRPSLFRQSQNSDVRLSCHTMALYTGSPVSASHTMVVSRWLVIPIAAMLSPLISMEVMASAMTEACDDQISIGLCSTQPGLGNIWVNSFCDTAFV